MKDKAQGKLEELKGKATGSKTEELKGKGRQKVGDAKRAVRSATREDDPGRRDAPR